MGFSLCWLLLLRSTGSRLTSFSNCSVWTQQLWLLDSRVLVQKLWLTALVAPRLVESSLTRNRPVPPQLAGRFLTTRLPGKPHGSSDKQKCLKFIVKFINLILAFRLGIWGYYLRQPVFLWGPHCLPSLGAQWGSQPFKLASPGNWWPQRGLSLLIFWNDCWVLMSSGLQHWFPDTALSLLGLESFHECSIPLPPALNSAVWGLASKWAAFSGTK